MSDYVIRPAAAEDAAAIDRLFVEMLQTIYERTETPAETVGYMELKEELEGSRIYVAEAGGEVVAFASVEEHRDAAEPFLYLDDFSVTKRYRGRGIGRVCLCCFRPWSRMRRNTDLAVWGCMWKPKTPARGGSIRDTDTR